jgi:hypothetical protein
MPITTNTKNFNKNATTRSFMEGEYVAFVDEKTIAIIKSVLPHDRYMVEDDEGMTYIVFAKQLVLYDVECYLALKATSVITKATDKASKPIGQNNLFEIVDLHLNKSGWTGQQCFEFQKQMIYEKMNESMHQIGKTIIFINGKGSGVLREWVKRTIDNNYPMCEVLDACFRDYGYMGAIKVLVRGLIAC